MASSTAVVDQQAEGSRPVLEGPARASLREMIRSEVASARPRPVAARTVELMAEAALEPAEPEPGYRVLDRHGAPRLHDGTSQPVTLADLVAELKAYHAGLFLPPEPEPIAAPQPVEARDSTLATGATEMRAATARFVEAQSERLSVRRRAVMASAAGALAGLRARFARPAAEPATSGPPARPDPDAAWNAGTGRLGESVRDGLNRLRDRFGGLGDAIGGEAGSPHHRWLAGASAAALVAVVAAAFVLSGRDDPGDPAARPAAAQPPLTPPSSPLPPPAPAQEARAPDTVTPPPETGGDPEPETPAPPPNALTGSAQVIDTATLKLGGKVVHLFGVEWVRGGQAEELARYIAGRPVTCQPAPGSDSMNCLVDGRDLSEVVLFNGGGRASPEASPDLVAAEDHARSERMGVWKR